MKLDPLNGEEGGARMMMALVRALGLERPSILITTDHSDQLKVMIRNLDRFSAARLLELIRIKLEPTVPRT